jgi:YVTN family beta-propeller protein
VAHAPAGSNPYWMVYDAANGNIYVSNYASNNISVINGATNTVVANIPLSTSAAPLRPALDPRNGLLYVPESGAGNVGIVNTSTNQVTAYAVAGCSPHSALWDSGNGLVYVPCWGGGVYVFNGTSKMATVSVGTNPLNAEYDSATGLVYVTNQASNDIYILNGTSSTGVDIPLPSASAPNFLTYDPQNGYIYVGDYGTSQISVLNGAYSPTKNKVLANLTVGSNPTWPVYDPTNHLVYVPNYGSSNVTVISGLSRPANIPLGTNPYFGTYDSADTHIYISDYGSSQASVIDGSTNSALTPINVGTSPRSAIYDSGNGDVYVANSGSSNISVISTGSVVTGHVYLSTPSGVSKNTPVYGTEVYIQGANAINLTGAAGNYAVATHTTQSALTVCAKAPGLQPSTGGYLVANPGQPECDTVTLTGQTTSHDLLVRSDPTTLYPTASSSPLFANIDGCYQPVGTCTSSTGVAFFPAYGLTTNMASDQASQISAASAGITTAPDCATQAGCNYVSLSGTESQGGILASTYWEVLPLAWSGAGSGLPLSSPMQLTYYVYSTTPCGQVATDIAFADGSWLHYIRNNAGSYILGGDGKRIAPASQCIPQGVWTPEVVDLSEISNRTAVYIAVGFQSTPSTAGSFQAYFSGIEIQLSEQQNSVSNGNFAEELLGWTASGDSPPSTGVSQYAGPYADLGPASAVGSSSPPSTSSLTQELRIPNVIQGGQLCLNVYTYSNDPNPSADYQRAFIIDRTTGLTYYLLGSASSGAYNSQVWSNSICLDLTSGGSDLRGDRVWIELEVYQSNDNYRSYALFNGIEFTPDNIQWVDQYNPSSSNNYGFSGDGVNTLVYESMAFNLGLFPLQSEPPYFIPFTTGSYVSSTSQPGGSTGLTWTSGLSTGFQFNTFTRNGPVVGYDDLEFNIQATGIVGAGNSTPASCNVQTVVYGDQPCLFVQDVLLGIGFLCQSGCGTGQNAFTVYLPANPGGFWSMGLVPTCLCPSSVNGLSIALDVFGLAVGIIGIAVAAPFSGGLSLAALPLLLGAIGIGGSIASLGVDLLSPTAGVPLSGSGCTSSISGFCPAYGFGDPNPDAGGLFSGSAMMSVIVQSPEISGVDTVFNLVSVAHLDVGEVQPPSVPWGSAYVVQNVGPSQDELNWVTVDSTQQFD